MACINDLFQVHFHSLQHFNRINREIKMSQQDEYQVCDACGVTAEMGFMINEGDDVADVTIFAASKEAAMIEFQRYLSLAKEVNVNVIHNLNENAELDLNPLVIKFKFECSAEKLIFELKSRSICAS